ncbi:MAG: hypothetical protein A2W17_12550 [Planctomycetes bacterium RBG_16_41_13]|nr:MAG: hypothetical protein A2W17_12550 [Planctomycetes bacterium RBG_16_41_13]
MNTIELLLDTIKKLEVENESLRKENSKLDKRCRDIYGEYRLLYYQMQDLPSGADIVRMQMEILTLKQEVKFLRGD